MELELKKSLLSNNDEFCAFHHAVDDLEQQVDKSIDGLYSDIKSYLCCTVSNSVQDLLISWTVCGAVGLAFAVLCSIRVIRHTLANRR